MLKAPPASGNGSLVVWLAADDGVEATSGVVTGLTNYGMAGGVATPVTAGQGPTLTKLDGNAVLVFPNTTPKKTLLGSLNIPTVTGFSIFFVYKNGSVIQTSQFSAQTAAGQSWDTGCMQISQWNAGQTQWAQHAQLWAGALPNPSGLEVFSGVFNPSGAFKAYVHGGNVVTNTRSPLETMAWTRYQLGVTADYTFAEVLLYNTALGDADRQEVEKYLFTKYNIPILQ
jgi:hypothetical protein